MSTLTANAEIESLLNNCKSTLEVLLADFGWNEADTLKNHHQNATNKPIEGKQVENKDDPPLPEAFACNNSIVIDNAVISNLCHADKSVPQKFSDLQLNFTREEKLLMYEYVIGQTEKQLQPDPPVFLSAADEQEKRLSLAEIVAIKKAEKKKKRKFRVSKPTHIEEVRGLVELQMQALQQFLEQENGRRRKEKKRKRSRSRSRERDRHKRKKSERSRSREDHRRRSRSRERDYRGYRSKHKRRSRSKDRRY